VTNDTRRTDRCPTRYSYRSGGKTRARHDCVGTTAWWTMIIDCRSIRGLVIELMKISVVNMTVKRHSVGLVTSFLSAAFFNGNRPFCVFEAPFGELRGNVRRLSQAHWKARSGLPISVDWTFFARCYDWGATSDYWLKIGDFAPMGVCWPKISGRRGFPPPTILLRKLG